jgi:hypothetical protein
MLLLQLERVMFRRTASINKHKRNIIFHNWSKQCKSWKTFSVTNIQHVYVFYVKIYTIKLLCINRAPLFVIVVNITTTENISMKFFVDIYYSWESLISQWFRMVH